VKTGVKRDPKRNIARQGGFQAKGYTKCRVWLRQMPGVKGKGVHICKLGVGGQPEGKPFVLQVGQGVGLLIGTLESMNSFSRGRTVVGAVPWVENRNNNH